MPSRMLFVNLAVADLGRSVEFFTALGFTFDERFTDETTTSMVISDQAFAMLMTRERFGGFIEKEVADSTRTTEAILAVSADSREEVDRLCDTALARGGGDGPRADHGFMYYRSFTDPDGHHWEVVWMDPAAVPPEA